MGYEVEEENEKKLNRLLKKNAREMRLVQHRGA
jgi:hypothetical protein